MDYAQYESWIGASNLAVFANVQLSFDALGSNGLVGQRARSERFKSLFVASVPDFLCAFDCQRSGRLVDSLPPVALVL